MIVSFSVSNFRSFSSEETFSLISSKRLQGQHETHTIPIPDSDQTALRVGVLYGANGAGKSNLFKAIRYLKSVALDRREKGTGTEREAFRLGESASELSTFDLQFVVAGKVYRFGFKVDDDRITEEWLARVLGKREQVIYERITDSSGKVVVEAPGLKGQNEKLDALTTVGGPQNQSFLATVKVTLETPDYGDELGEIIKWFRESLVLIGPSASFRRLGHFLASNQGCAEFASTFLKAASTGIDHLEISKNEITEEDFRDLLPKVPQDLVTKVLNNVQEDGDGKALFKLSEGNELLVERSPENHYYRITIRSAHEGIKGDFIPFELDEESDGTRRLLNFMPALHNLRTKDSVYIIDEIDRSMHPNMVWELLDFFLKSCSDCRSQIIVTTHESNLLDLSLLRRDEIWFAERDSTSATRLYSLSEFKVRNDLEIRKHYLQGRFGAVPFLGDLNRLIEQESQPQ